jgi:hypothetical protein
LSKPRAKKNKAPQKSPDSKALFDFKVWIQRDEESDIFAAYCLETGSVATADDSETAEELLDEVIVSEAVHALDTKNFANLYSSPAPPEIWDRWHKLAKTQRPTVRFLQLRPEVTTAPKKPTCGVPPKVELSRFA